MKSHRLNKKGFTLIELIVVFTIIAILSTIGTASFVSYSRTQSLNQAANDLVQTLNSAKSFSASQLKDLSRKDSNQVYRQCESQSLSGYGVRMFPQLNAQNQRGYAIYIRCVNNNGVPTDYPTALDDAASGVFTALPSDVNFDTSPTDNPTTNISDVFFPVLSGGVLTSGDGPTADSIVLKSNYNISPKTISITQGYIKIQ